MRGECCHYDEGYDEGFEDGKDERGFERDDVVEALRVVSRRWFLAGRHAEADLLEGAAEEIGRDTSVQRQVEAERVRLAEIVKLFAAERSAG